MDDYSAIAFCQTHSEHLSNWESDFIDSVSSAIDEYRDGLTDRQSEKLAEIVQFVKARMVRASQRRRAS